MSINPRMPAEMKNFLMGAWKDPKVIKRLEEEASKQICLATSGTTGIPKWVVLSEKAILISAKAVNNHLESNSSDVWFHTLPDFHVGGLGIMARSSLSGAAVIKSSFPEGRWDPVHFVEQLAMSGATLTALVPTQVFDLVMKGLQSPLFLRAVIVGGGALSDKLYSDAKILGWKLLPSYGLTECSSQVATACHQSANLTPLDHVELALELDGRLKIRSEALLTAYIDCSQDDYRWRDPKVDGWFTTEDYAVLEDGKIKTIRRNVDFVKIGGESVDLNRLRRILEEEALTLRWQTDMTLVALPDDRLGHIICLKSVRSESDITQLVDKYQQRVLPFERIRNIDYVESIPRSPLGKVFTSP
ncbi:MAG: AMP-binding protein [Parachlamydiaceae bacterium]